MATRMGVFIMKITKFGHSCLLIEEKKVRILIDPGSYSSGFENLANLDVILYTHEHSDHVNLDSLTKLITNNPSVQIRTNSGVGKLLTSKNIQYKLLTDGQSEEFKGVKIQAIGEHHAIIHESINCVDNTGYLIAGKFFYPGDFLTTPDEKVEILALPIEAPWLKLGDVINYVSKIKPKTCFVVHDARLNENGLKGNVNIVSMALASSNVKVDVLEKGKTYEF